MASRFVSGGTLEKPAERDSEWLKAQQELEDKRRQKEEESKQQDGKSLYQVLQENKGMLYFDLVHPAHLLCVRSVCVMLFYPNSLAQRRSRRPLRSPRNSRTNSGR